ncbi:hypothetical protein LINPERPRIM_LOCUS10029 [Linum perenne]
MHYNGVLQPEGYVYGQTAFFDNVDPDLFSMVELTAMGRSVNVEGEYYQYLWLSPGKEIDNGLNPLECEEDIRGFINALDGNHLIKVYVKKMTHFQAWKRMFEVKMSLYKRLTEPPGGGVQIEEFGEPASVNEVGNQSKCGIEPPVGRILQIQWSEGDNATANSGSNVAVNTPTVEVIEEDVAVETPPVAVIDKQVASETPTVAVRDEEVAIATPHVAVIEEQVASETPPVAVIDEEVGIATPPVAVIEEQVAIQTPPAVIDEEVGIETPGDDIFPNLTNILELNESDERETLEFLWESGGGNHGPSANAYEGPTDSDTSSFRATGWDSNRDDFDDTSDDSDDSNRLLGFKDSYKDQVYSDDTESDDESFTVADEDLDYVSSDDASDLGFDDFLGDQVRRPRRQGPRNKPARSEHESEGSGDDGHGLSDTEDAMDEAELFHETGWGSEEDDNAGQSSFPHFNIDRDIVDDDIVIGTEFDSLGDFKTFCRSHAIRQRRGVQFPVNDKKRVKAECIRKCGFWLFASYKDKVDSVRLISGHTEHSCGVEEDLRVANPSFLAKKYLSRFRVDPSWSLRNIVHTIITDMGLKISPMKAYRTKQLALKLIHGEGNAQFAKLMDYKQELERTNPGSTVAIEYDVLTFKRIYICLDALKRGFRVGCRKFIGVDGCFLKCMVGWQLLVAVGVDANDGIFPIAWAVVQRENEATWGWFMELLAADLEITNAPGWTFMSDRQKVNLLTPQSLKYI